MFPQRRQLLLLVVAGASRPAGRTAYGHVPEAWLGCEREVARHCPKARDEEAIFACIAKRIARGAKAKLSDACYAAYERYELRKCDVGGCEEHE